MIELLIAYLVITLLNGILIVLLAKYGDDITGWPIILIPIFNIFTFFVCVHVLVFELPKSRAIKKEQELELSRLLTDLQLRIDGFNL